MNRLKQLIEPNDEINKGLLKAAGLMGEFELDISTINPEVLDLIYGVQKPIEEQDQDFTIVFDFSYQARRHRKKRINKKWLKKYGIKTKTITSEGWRFVGDKDDRIYLNIERIRRNGRVKDE